MTSKSRVFFLGALLVLTITLQAQVSSNKSSDPFGGDSDARPPVTPSDVRIVQRARNILSSPSKWNRADTRICPNEAVTFSLYCALEKATDEVIGNFEHRGAAMQEARFLIDEITAKKDYEHRLRDYNNDPATTFADIQKMFQVLEKRIKNRLREQSRSNQSRVRRYSPVPNP